MSYDRIKKQIVIEPMDPNHASGGIDEEFSQQTSDFIEQCQPALNELIGRRTTPPDD